MHRTNIYLEERQTQQLDQLARAEGVSRAEMIRRLIDRSLEGRDDGLAADLAAIDLSFGVLADVELAPEQPVGRGPDERSEHLERLWGARG